jgi:hypothetical protein
VTAPILWASIVVISAIAGILLTLISSVALCGSDLVVPSHHDKRTVFFPHCLKKNSN